MNKKIIAVIVGFFMVCAGVVTYIQIDKHQTEKAAQLKEQEQIKKIQEDLDKTINAPRQKISEGKGTFK